MKKIAVLVSGGGTNLQALIEYEKENGYIVKVIYNDPSDPIPIPEIYLIDWELVPTTE